MLTNDLPVLLQTVRSGRDRTVKFVFQSQGQVMEYSFIDKADGKHIICAPTQTACNLGCKFCYLSDYDLKVRNLTAGELLYGVTYVIEELRASGVEVRADCLLVSFMGCGEPLLNQTQLFRAMVAIQREFSDRYRVVRFAVATLMPRLDLMSKFIERVKEHDLQVKLHLSLHTPDQTIRSHLMPGASAIGDSVEVASAYKRETGQAVEIHYALMEDVNDRPEDAVALVVLLRGRGMNVKFLAYNARAAAPMKRSQRLAEMCATLEEAGIPTEYYDPPGSDIGSSCGQFLMEYYALYNRR